MTIPMYTVEESDYGVWIKFPNGRSRYALKGSELYAQVMEGINNPALRERGRDVTVYYRDAEGNLGVPPTADTPIPEGCERLEATTIFEQDRLGKKLAEQEGRKWAGSREANEAIEESLGSPRQHLIDKMATGRFKSNLERDVVELMVKDLDREEADRNRHTIDFSVYARNYDSKRR